ncbi:DUF1822 family protein (plasmid) [Kovacikia minuta CCNUW1]|uniref:DUF1822 family protein n=1 Tax=Kovacikia minuta TaxID=2931930 RepID=UPI001CCD6B7C|nr:DUF1822 family protein [Kovacikia minuta]UBF29803.1 DUF1822 family protein [Kovacikia minuta CCNUW1]
MSAQIDMTNLLVDLEALQEAIVPLESEHFQRAAQMSQAAIAEAHQWRTYVNGLALCSFVQWLQERAPDLPVQQDLCTLLQPQYASVLEAVCNLKVGNFTICLIVTESVAREMVNIPRIVVDLPEFVAHFYVLLEVQEEQEQTILRGCLRYDQLLQYRQVANLQPDDHWQYQFPLDGFDPDSSHLLFYLRLLDPIALPLPTASAYPVLLPALQQEALAHQLPQLSADADLPEVLTWEQAAVLLTNPPLLNLLYLLHTRPEQRTAITGRLTELLTQINQQVINVWRWSQDRLDETAQAFAWSMPRSLSPAMAMRRSSEKVEAALQDLTQQQGIELPPQARYAYLTLEEMGCQICAVTWLMPAEEAEQGMAAPMQEWALMLILVAQPGKIIPLGTRLQVSTTTVLADVMLETTDLYLYIMVEGNQQEAFTTTISAPNAVPITLPPFVCHPRQLSP